MSWKLGEMFHKGGSSQLSNVAERSSQMRTDMCLLGLATWRL